MPSAGLIMTSRPTPAELAKMRKQHIGDGWTREPLSVDDIDELFAEIDALTRERDEARAEVRLLKITAGYPESMCR